MKFQFGLVFFNLLALGGLVLQIRSIRLDHNCTLSIILTRVGATCLRYVSCIDLAPIKHPIGIYCDSSKVAYYVIFESTL